ncbi:hypothetical protein G6F31_017262 [Rhizopus arrhizus]|nr:hypothetical protein G6F31_017262 [Rhizopus arrhizus]
MNSLSSGSSSGIPECPPSAIRTLLPTPARIARIVPDQRAQHAGGVGTAARAGVVLRVGDDNGLAGVLRQPHGFLPGFVGGVEPAAAVAFGVQHGARHFRGCRVGVGLRSAVGPYRRRAFGEVCGGKARGERQARRAARFDLAHQFVQAARRFDIGGLPAQRNQVGQGAQRCIGPRHAGQPQ